MVALPLRLKRRGFSRADWVGDGVVTVALGLAVVAGVFLPWANYSTGHDVNLSAHSSPGINGRWPRRGACRSSGWPHWSSPSARR